MQITAITARTAMPRTISGARGGQCYPFLYHRSGCAALQEVSGHRRDIVLLGHVLMVNRSGLTVQGDVTQADGHAERRTVLDMIRRHSPGST